MILLKAELVSRGKFLSASVIAYVPSIGYGQTDYVLKIVDWINIMTYDSNDQGGHASVTMTNQSLYYWVHTIISKTKWAMEHAGGVMIWEVTQDSQTESLSLLHAISETVSGQ